MERPPAASTVTFAHVHDDVPSRVTGSSTAGSGPDDTLTGRFSIFRQPRVDSEGVPHGRNAADGSIQLKYVEGVPRLAIGKIGHFGPILPALAR